MQPLSGGAFQAVHTPINISSGSDFVYKELWQYIETLQNQVAILTNQSNKTSLTLKSDQNEFKFFLIHFSWSKNDIVIK